MSIWVRAGAPAAACGGWLGPLADHESVTVLVAAGGGGGCRVALTRQRKHPTSARARASLAVLTAAEAETELGYECGHFTSFFCPDPLLWPRETVPAPDERVILF